jgi:hypothetical protein
MERIMGISPVVYTSCSQLDNGWVAKTTIKVTSTTPWVGEPDCLKYTDPETQYQCLILRSPWGGTLNGYVRVPRTHPLYLVDGTPNKALWNIDVHGGVTLAGKLLRRTGGLYRGRWIGFDCAHFGDLIPTLLAITPNLVAGDTYRDIQYVRQQVTSLAEQLKAMESWK